MYKRRHTPLFLADNFPGWELTPAEVEFGQAMRRYQLKYNRRFPAWSEVLDVLLSLGYRRILPPESSPEVVPCSDSPASAVSCRPAA